MKTSETSTLQGDDGSLTGVSPGETMREGAEGEVGAKRLRVYSLKGGELYVATSAEEAWSTCFRLTGEGRESDDGPAEEFADDRLIAIWDDDERVTRTLTAAEWAARTGPGYLAGDF